MKAQHAHIYEFGAFQLDPAEHTLLHDGKFVPLTPKVFDTLLILIENNGHLVEKDEIIEKVWSDTIVEEANLAKNISILRKVLSEDGLQDPFIETIPKRGYRFVAPVKQIEVENLSDEINESQGPATRLLAKTQIGLIATILVISAIGFTYWFFSGAEKQIESVAEGKKSIFVLPVKPIDTANRDKIYEIGIAHSVILKLSLMKGFVVRPLSAIHKYADIEQDPVEAGKEQQVDYVLASNYQLSGGKIRIIAQLFNMASGQIEETYKIEKDAGDIFAMQDAIANEVSNNLMARFATTSSSPAAKPGTTNKEAYRMYLQGMNLYDRRNAADMREAVDFMEQAVRFDPNYALAWAGLAHTRGSLGVLGPGADKDENIQKAIEALKTALTLDPNLSEANSILCAIKTFYENDYAVAERACRRAIELNPDSPIAHRIYAQYLRSRGRFDEAIAEIQSAIDLEPTSSYNQIVLGGLFYYARRYDEAAAQFKKIIKMDENFGRAYGFLSMTLALQGKETEAFQWEMRGLALQKSNEKTVRAYQAVFQKSGWQGFLRERAIRFDSSNGNYYAGAFYNAEIGNKSKALDLLEKSYQSRDGVRIAYMQWEPRFNDLHDNPRFQELLRKIDLPREFD